MRSRYFFLLEANAYVADEHVTVEADHVQQVVLRHLHDRGDPPEEVAGRGRRHALSDLYIHQDKKV